jgi:hypothetical protein
VAKNTDETIIPTELYLLHTSTDTVVKWWSSRNVDII